MAEAAEPEGAGPEGTEPESTEPDAAAPDVVAPDAAAPDASPFTKDPQPELSLTERRRKAGITRNRILLWVVGVGFGLYLVITGIVGIITKSR